jgi:hypothetical protein
MGIQGAHSLTYFVQKITLQQLYSIALLLYHKRSHVIPRMPTIYVDASWIVRSCTVDDRVSYLVRLSSFLVESGFRIVIVCDGSSRHHSKRSTIKRVAESYNARICLHRNNTFLMNLLNKQNVSDSIEERDRLNEAITTNSAKVSTLQNKVKRSGIDVGADLFCQLSDSITKLKLNVNQLSVVQAEFQADSVLAGSLFNHDADLVLTADSDMAALVGGNCYGIKSFKFIDRSRTRSLKDIEIFSSDLSSINSIVNGCSIPNTNIVLAKKPIFEGIQDMRTRCLIGVGVGCDVFVKGVPGITPKVIMDILQKFKETNLDDSHMFQFVLNKFLESFYNYARKPSNNMVYQTSHDLQMFKAMLIVFVDCMVYEPTNTISCFDNTTINVSNLNTYINENE